MNLGKLAISGLIAYSVVSGGCDNYQKEIERMRECRESTHTVQGTVTETDYDKSFIDGTRFSFTVQTGEYGIRRFISEDSSMGPPATATNLYEKVLTGNNVGITLSTCTNMNARNIKIPHSSSVKVSSD